jgi:hypothetical protein
MRPTQEWLVWQCTPDRKCTSKCPAYVDDPPGSVCGLFAQSPIARGEPCFVAALADALGTPLLHAYSNDDEEALADLTNILTDQLRELRTLKQEVAALRQQVMGGRNGTASRRTRRVR